MEQLFGQAGLLQQSLRVESTLTDADEGFLHKTDGDASFVNWLDLHRISLAVSGRFTQGA
jgi:hypothetical protein